MHTSTWFLFEHKINFKKWENPVISVRIDMLKHDVNMQKF